MSALLNLAILIRLPLPSFQASKALPSDLGAITVGVYSSFTAALATLIVVLRTRFDRTSQAGSAGVPPEDELDELEELEELDELDELEELEELPTPADDASPPPPPPPPPPQPAMSKGNVSEAHRADLRASFIRLLHSKNIRGLEPSPAGLRALYGFWRHNSGIAFPEEWVLKIFDPSAEPPSTGYSADRCGVAMLVQAGWQRNAAHQSLSCRMAPIPGKLRSGGRQKHRRSPDSLEQIIREAPFARGQRRQEMPGTS